MSWFDDVWNWLTETWNFITGRLYDAVNATLDFARNAWNYITTTIWDWLRYAADRAGDTWNWLATTGINLLNAARDAATNAYNYIAITIWPWLQSAATNIVNLANWLYTSGLDLWNATKQLATDALAWITGTIWPWLQSAAGNIANLANWLYTSALALWNAALAVATDGYNYTKNTLVPWEGWHFTNLAGLSQGISSLLAPVAAGWSDELGRGLGDYVRAATRPDTPEWRASFGQIPLASIAGIRPLIQGATDDWTGFLSNIWEEMSTGFPGVRKSLGDWLGSAWQSIVKLFGEQVVPGVQSALSWLMDNLMGLFRAPLARLLEGPKRSSPPTLESGVAFAQEMFNLSLAGAVGLGAMSIAPEILHPLKHIGLGRVAAMIGDWTDYKSISQNYIGPLLKATMFWPSFYYFNNQFRPTRPPMRDLIEMRAKHEIDASHFARELGYQGTSDDDIAIYEGYVWRDPRLMEVVRLAEVSSPPETPDPRAWEWLQRAGLQPRDPRDWWFAYKMAKAGYEDVDVPVLTSTARLMSMRREQTLYLMQVRQLYRNGFIDAESARPLLRAAFLRDDVITFRLAAMDLELTYDSKADALSSLRARFVKGELDQDQFGAGLTTLGLIPTRQAFILQNDIAKTQGAIAAKRATDERASVRKYESLSQQLYRAQFAAGHVDSGQYLQALIALGIQGNVAQANVMLEQEKVAAKTSLADRRAAESAQLRTRRAAASAVREQFRAGVLDANAYRLGLVGLGIAPDEADAVIAQEQARLERASLVAEVRDSERRLAAGSRARASLLRERYLADDITDAAYVAGLIDLGIPQAEADATVGVARARKERAEATSTARRAESALSEERRLRATYLRAQFQGGDIDASVYLSSLLDLGIPRDSAAAIVGAERERLDRLAQAKADRTAEASRVKAASARADVLREQVRAQQITASQYTDQLAALGYPPALALALGDLETARLNERQDRDLRSDEEATSRKLQLAAVNLYRAQFARGDLSEAVYRDLLRSAGLDALYIDALVELETIKAEQLAAARARSAEEQSERREQSAKARLYREQYEQEVIAAEEYRRRLLDLGWPQELADAQVEYDALQFFGIEAA